MAQQSQQPHQQYQDCNQQQLLVSLPVVSGVSGFPQPRSKCIAQNKSPRLIVYLFRLNQCFASFLSLLSITIAKNTPALSGPLSLVDRVLIQPSPIVLTQSSINSNIQQHQPNDPATAAKPRQADRPQAAPAD
jgi:hypothetical protein